MSKIYVRFLLSVLFLFFVSGLSFANLSVKPAVINASVDRDVVCENKYYITNPNDNEITVTISKEDWKNSPDNDKSVTVEDWLSFDKNSYSVGPKETIEVPFKIKTDKKMSGSVSGRVTFVTGGGMIQMQVRVPIYLTIKGTENIDFSIDSLRVVNNSNDSDKIFYVMSLKNDGNIHIRHSGVCEIFNKNKKKLIKRVDLEQTFPTYAKESRVFSGFLSRKEDLKKGKYAAVFKVSAFNKEVSKEVKFKVLKTGKVKQLTK